MDERLKNFLIQRSISEKTIEEMDREKIDSNVIINMTGAELAKYLPAFGDRLAVIDFCRQGTDSNKRKLGLLDKLKLRVQQPQDLSGPSTSGQSSSKSKIGNKRKSLKSTRRISLGWLHRKEGNSYVQVKSMLGGGTRRMNVLKIDKKKELLHLGANLFFPEGKSSQYGNVENCELDILDFKRNKLPDDVTVEDIYQSTHLTDIRFYFASSIKNKTNNAATVLLSEQNKDEAAVHDVDEYAARVVIPEQDEDAVRVVISEEDEDADRVVISEQDEDVLQPHENSIEVSGSEYHLDLNNYFAEPQKIILRRGMVFNDLIDAFKTHGIRTFDSLKIEMLQPNGTPEKGIDIGGVFRDALSEFWEVFYEKCTTGTQTKVPVLQHDLREEDWKAIAAILVKGWRDVKYFPCKLSKVFVKQCLFAHPNISHEDLKQDLLNFISISDRESLVAALKKFDDVDIDDIIDAFSSLESKWKPTENNLNELILDLARSEFIQKPKYVSDVWLREIGTIMTVHELDQVFDSITPSVKNILNMIQYENKFDEKQEKTMQFLRKFIKESDERNRESFLRFCTGANMVVNNVNIHVYFNDKDGIDRSPTASVCSCDLYLPVTYKSFQEFRQEFNALLGSKFWNIDFY